VRARSDPAAGGRSPAYCFHLREFIDFGARFVVICSLVALVAVALAAPPDRFAGQEVSHRVRHFPRKLLALTFDDGPSSDITPRVLDTLTRYNAHATFFVLGSMASRRPDLLKREITAGHEIAVHGWTHSARLSQAQAASEITRTAALIQRVTGRAPALLRPPYGIARGAIAREAQRRGMPVILWTISSADTTRAGTDVLANNVIHTPNPGDIVLMHDGAGHRATAAALPRVLKALSAQGWRFVAVSELLAEWEKWDRSRRVPHTHR
jgi:peptidoglycan-N-acetylglucosamine deacetylase